MSWKSAVSVGSGILGVALFFSAAAAPPRPQEMQVGKHEVTLEVDPTQSKVHFTLDSTLHPVHGTFELKKGAGTAPCGR